jgi:excisionase family DNA binding protein
VPRLALSGSCDGGTDPLAWDLQHHGAGRGGGRCGSRGPWPQRGTLAEEHAGTEGADGFALTIKQVADYYQLDPKTIRRMIAHGKLKARRVGERSIRVDRESLLELGRVKYWGT